MVLRNRQTRPSLGGLDQTETKTDQTIPITGSTLSMIKYTMSNCCTVSTNNSQTWPKSECDLLSTFVR
ncbi:hypothetical protein BGZ61DRAFT_373142 [Ilyonectria robusta]|uniref:uncharacterized protein n=1 Tax=Ilyonectria robusta TaxID=1079257 RepID=UPI001E8D2637|nr:uncharacterized protein BGZ61DRAFT_373142 [Ilyonectria robusta]KAH8654811.1 hypothetical protein BGZ61DRAFT_373142 [Ilyonectria robusta]